MQKRPSQRLISDEYDAKLRVHGGAVAVLSGQNIVLVISFEQRKTMDKRIQGCLGGTSCQQRRTNLLTEDPWHM